ncbi:MAG: tryptophan--tRNA ligase [Bacteroidota bacterium]
METVLSGMRPTGKLHLGNYLGAGINYVKMQEKYNCFYFIADYHALTTHTKASELNSSISNVLAEYLAIGVDPEKATIYIQSHVPQIPELYLILNMFAYKGELEKCTTFKEKARKEGQTLNAGLLTYPVLMAADILIHKANKVPVGEDQKPHIEMARNFAQRFNHYYETEVFPMPDATNEGENLIRVPSLQGTGKMSKSDAGDSAIYLIDDKDTIIKKVKRAKTDAGPTTPNQTKPQEIENLFYLMKLVSSAETLAHFEEAYNNCSIRYGDFKMQLGEDMNQYIAPIREKYQSLINDRAYLLKVVNEGGEKARAHAQKTIDEVRNIVGLNSMNI